MDEHQVLNEQKFAKRLYHHWWFWLAVGLLALGAWYLRGYIEAWSDSALDRENDRRGVAEYVELLKAAQKLDAMKAQDTYGGETPQETWGMFVAALEQGDTDLAAKYFVVWKQDEEKKAWAVAKSLGNIEIFLQDFELILGGRMYDSGEMYEFYTGSIDGGLGFVYTLVLNTETNVWKIESL